MSPDGSSAVNLTPTPGVAEFTPSFSPDGKRIAYSRSTITETDVYVTASDAVTPVNLTPTLAPEATAPDWEPIFRCAKGKATIVGTDSAETLRGTKGADIIVANGGNDKVVGKGGRDRLCGGFGKDKLRGGAGKDGLYGQQGKDNLGGGKGKDKLVGGKGKDKQVQ